MTASDGVLTPDLVRRFSAELMEAESRVLPVEPLTSRVPGITVGDAYQIQMHTVKTKVSRGARVVGKKIGLTSAAMQDLLGVSEPDYGHLLDVMWVPEGEPVPASRMCQPKAEGEVAFILGKDLRGPGLTAVDVLRATEGVVAAIEVVDSRIRDWKIKIQDTVADNASSAMFVLGGKMVSPLGIDLRYTGMVLEKNGRIVNTGAGAAVLGHPASSVAWLANKLAEFGMSIGAGEIVLSGAVTAAPPVAPGDAILVTFDELGPVGCRFV
ncbi:MAG: fumarylacetoacetate hydrolase family protein [Firmicutes bacterium]|jgi:2-keto-4-pentenoate hydratase|nr:fumarylacetoacetate hydrolase family protein [Bacillota bacterium]